MKNFEVERLNIQQTLPAGTRLLLHSCCAPCSTSVIERLAQHFKLTVFFYNPNLDTEAEYQKRLAEQQRFLAEYYPNITVIENGYCGAQFLQQVKGLEDAKEGGVRCAECFKMRFDALAARAKVEGVAWVTSTLSVSPLKSATMVNEVGEVAAKSADVHWLPADWKKQNGYLRSVERSKQCGLYRQNYCGCIFSKEAAEKQKHKI